MSKKRPETRARLLDTTIDLLLSEEKSDLRMIDVAKAAWDNRLAAMKQGCAAAIAALARDGRLRTEWSETTASDYYFTLLGIDAWAHCVLDCGWSEVDYLAQVQRVTREAFVSPA